jgi:hypothetical protein
MIETALVESVGRGLDAVLFDNVAGDAVHPAGLRHGVAGLTPSSGGSPKNDLMADDLVKLAAPVAKVAGSANVVFVCTEPQAMAINFRTTREFAYAILPTSGLCCFPAFMPHGLGRRITSQGEPLPSLPMRPPLAHPAAVSASTWSRCGRQSVGRRRAFGWRPL